MVQKYSLEVFGGYWPAEQLATSTRIVGHRVQAHQAQLKGRDTDHSSKAWEYHHPLDSATDVKKWNNGLYTLEVGIQMRIVEGARKVFSSSHTDLHSRAVKLSAVI